VASENVLPLNRFLTFSRRRGWLPQIAAGGLLLLIVGGFALNSLLASLYGPDGTAVSYVQAIGRGDTAAAWSLMTVAGGPAPAGTADLATQAGLRGWLHLEPARTGRTNVGVSGHRDVPGGVQVTVTYQDNGRTTSSQLDLVEDPAAKHFAIYPTWRVLVVPSVVSIRSPGVPYGVDGNLLNATTTAVRILPGRHVLATKPTDLFGPFATTVDVEGGQPGTATLEPKLNSSAAPGVSGVITQAFQACLANPYSGTCPAAFLQFQGNSKLTGDPGADVTVALTTRCVSGRASPAYGFPGGGATWVAVHHGGGVGIGYSIHAGMVVVADGTANAADRLERVLTSDPGTGVARHADAGYPRAIEVAEERHVRIPMGES